MHEWIVKEEEPRITKALAWSLVKVLITVYLNHDVIAEEVPEI
jgi:hypothetical protein